MKHRQQGVTMIEVLVSIVIVAIGILGLTALQGVSMRNTTSAGLRSTAAMLARDMGDRMRANQGGLDDGYYGNLTGTPSNPGCVAAGCTRQQLANYDYWRWNQEIANTLPQGRGWVCWDSTPETAPCDNATNSVRSLTIKVFWDDNRNASDLKSFSMVVAP